MASAANRTQFFGEPIVYLGRRQERKHAEFNPQNYVNAKALEPLIPDHNAILMQNHGVVAYGETLERAYMNMETVEHCARIMLVTKLLGQSTILGDHEVKRLLHWTAHQ